MKTVYLKICLEVEVELGHLRPEEGSAAVQDGPPSRAYLLLSVLPGNFDWQRELGWFAFESTPCFMVAEKREDHGSRDPQLAKQSISVMGIAMHWAGCMPHRRLLT